MAHESREIEVIARGAAFRTGRVLLCRSVKHGYHYLPGGHVEFGEAAGAALAREFKEETGLDVNVGPCVLVTEGAFSQGGKERHEVNLVFHVEHSAWGLSPPPVRSLEPKIAFDWIELAAVVDMDVRPEALRAWLVSGAGRGSSGIEWASAIGAQPKR